MEIYIATVEDSEGGTGPLSVGAFTTFEAAAAAIKEYDPWGEGGVVWAQRSVFKAPVLNAKVSQCTYFKIESVSHALGQDEASAWEGTVTSYELQGLEGQALCEICKECERSGHIQVDSNEYGPYARSYRTIKCPKCQGAGVLPSVPKSLGQRLTEEIAFGIDRELFSPEQKGTGPSTYFPPMWLYDRAIVADTSGKEFVILHLRLGPSREESSAELVPFDSRPSSGERLSLDKVEQGFTPTGRRGSIIRW